ncbi:nucleoside hydrolase [Pseudomonas sp. PCH446]
MTLPLTHRSRRCSAPAGRGVQEPAADLGGATGRAARWPGDPHPAAQRNRAAVHYRQRAQEPHEVTLLAIGPLTNLALAIRQAPDIVPLIKRIVYMGGAIEIPGNTTPAAEFNWWFDPEAAKIVLRSPIEHVIFPNDVCEKVTFDASVYQRVIAAKGAVRSCTRACSAHSSPRTPGTTALPGTACRRCSRAAGDRHRIPDMWIDVDTHFGRTMVAHWATRRTRRWERRKPGSCSPWTRRNSGTTTYR